MASTDYQPPDLASILQTLAALAPPPQPQPHHPPLHQPQAPPSDLEEGEYDPSTFQPSPPITLPPPPIVQPPSQPTPTTSQPTPSTSLITAYPPALRHITHLLTTQRTILPRLRHLLRSAHTHEQQWWNGRLALQSRLSNRAEGRQKIAAVLANLGGHVKDVEGDGDGDGEGEAEGEGGVDMEGELRAYDRKVHRAYGEMVRATGEELGKLGVPFFGEGWGDGEERGEGKVGKEELGRLRARMVAFLEDMVKE